MAIDAAERGWVSSEDTSFRKNRVWLRVHQVLVRVGVHKSKQLACIQYFEFVRTHQQACFSAACGCRFQRTLRFVDKSLRAVAPWAESRGGHGCYAYGGLMLTIA